MGSIVYRRVYGLRFSADALKVAIAAFDHQAIRVGIEADGEVSVADIPYHGAVTISAPYAYSRNQR
jgi:hypothetical protein